MMAVVEGCVRTATGRLLAYTQMGQQDGTTVFSFHGVPGSRLDFDHPLIRPVVEGSGVRLIGIDRPGFGGSTHQPHGDTPIGPPMFWRLPTTWDLTGSASSRTRLAACTPLLAPWLSHRG